MATLQENADEIKGKLDSIIQSTNATAANTAATNSSVVALDAHLQSGFANLSQGLYALIQLEKVSIALQEHNRKQNNTIICLLENSNELLCGITRKITQQLELQEGILRSVERIEGIGERVNAGEAADYDRLAALDEKIELCCPPEQPQLEPCPEPCGKDDYRPVDPKGQNWTPLPAPGPRGEARRGEAR